MFKIFRNNVCNVCNNERIIDIISVKLEVRTVRFIRADCSSDSPRITWKSGLQPWGSRIICCPGR